jgi:hypothetical protein|tara:strand:- start:4077 stop:4670 length:594 start_codon:yes stop_codon:yes gene_type:complete
VAKETDFYQAALKKWAGLLTDAAKRTLGTRKIGKNKTYGKASGSLQKSLKFSIDGKDVLFGSPDPSAAFIYWGVNGTDKRRGSPFSYGAKQPPSDAIKKWMKVKPVRLRDKSGAFISQQDIVITRGKNKGKKRNPLDSAAYLIARSIKKKGIASLKYWEIAYKETLPRAEKELSQAFAKDLFSHFAVKVGNIKMTSK